MVGGWVAAGWAAMAYGIYLTVIALRLPPGGELTGHWMLQPPFKASMAVLLAIAALAHPIARERRWLVPALLFSACGDWLLSIPWWTMSFILGLGSFLLAHICFLGALLPHAAASRERVAAAVVMVLGTASMLIWLWPHLNNGKENLTLPVTVYIAVLSAMVCAALLARLPTIWTAVGAVCFAASDSMIAISRFILGNEALAVPIWWSYAAAEILITAGFFFGREDLVDSRDSAPDTAAPAES
jgi:uncharacterized membrane protein YhhN